MPQLTSANPLREALGRGSGILVAAFVLTFFFNLLSLTGPMFMLLIYDRVLPSGSEETLVALFGLVVVLLVVLALIDYSRRRILARFGAQFQERIEERLFSTAGRGRYFQRGSRKPMAGLDDLDNLRGFINSGALIAVMDMFWAPMFLFAIFVLHPLLGWVALVGMAALVGLSALRWTVAIGREERQREAGRDIAALKEMIASGRDVVRTQEMTSGYRGRWVRARQQSRDRSIELRDMTTWFGVFCRQLHGLVRYGVLAVGAWLTLQGELTIGAMVASTFLAVRALNPLDAFLDEAPLIWRSFGNWSALRDILAGGGAIEADAGPALDADPAAALVLQRISARSPVTGMTILRNVSLRVSPGRVVEIAGPSGAGKTLLAEAILGLAPLSAGLVLYRGAIVSRLSPADAARSFGYLPETADVVSGTVADNITRLDPAPDTAWMIEAARTAQVHDMIMALPGGYQTPLDRTERCFSRGERARIALARAIYAAPDLLVIDEPDAGVRRLLQRDLRPMLDAMKARGAVVIVLAREPLGLRNATRYTLDGGKLAQVDTAQPQKEGAKVTPLVRG